MLLGDDHHLDGVAARQTGCRQLRFVRIKLVQRDLDAVQLPAPEQNLDGPVGAEETRTSRDEREEENSRNAGLQPHLLTW